MLINSYRVRVDIANLLAFKSRNTPHRSTEGKLGIHPRGCHLGGLLTCPALCDCHIVLFSVYFRWRIDFDIAGVNMRKVARVISGEDRNASRPFFISSQIHKPSLISVICIQRDLGKYYEFYVESSIGGQFLQFIRFWNFFDRGLPLNKISCNLRDH